MGRCGDFGVAKTAMKRKAGRKSVAREQCVRPIKFSPPAARCEARTASSVYNSKSLSVN